jgi:cytoskeletal protein CcmA (bactofilin family)
MSAPASPALQIHPGIMLKDVVLTGKFEGELQTLGCLTVASGGAITGSIDAGALVLEPGNLVEARVKVGPPPKANAKAKAAGEKAATGGFWSGGFQKLKAAFTLGRK